MKPLRYLLAIVWACLTIQTSYSQQSDKNVNDSDKKLFSFGLIADAQYADVKSSGARYYRNSIKKLDDCVSEFNKHDLSFTITLGDLIDQDYRSFDKVLPILNRLNAPVYNIVGNHDFTVEEEFKKEVRGRLNNKKGYFDLTIGDFIFIVLDGTDLSTFASAEGSKQHHLAMAKYEELKAAKYNNAVTWNGGIGDKQFKWLDKKLQNAERKNKKAILFCHWPLLPENMTQLWNNREVLSLINSHENVVAWISGHHHGGSYQNAGNIHHLTVKGMVETEYDSSYGIMEVYYNKLLLRGYGNQEDLILEF